MRTRAGEIQRKSETISDKGLPALTDTTVFTRHARLHVASFVLEVLLRLVRGVPRPAVLTRLEAPLALPDELGLRVVSLLVKLRLARERLGLVRVRLRLWLRVRAPG